MNCGMEDVLVLDTFMSEKFPDDRLKAFNEYSKYRNPDAEAICDLAMYNYIEMRDLVNKTSFLLRKKVCIIFEVKGEIICISLCNKYILYKVSHYILLSVR